MAILEVKQLTKVFKTSQGTDFVALKEINLAIEKQEIFGVIGLSGAGKSTLVRCLNLLEKPTSGDVFFNGKNLMLMQKKELLETRSDIGMIFQTFNLLSQSSVYDNIAFPLKIKKWPKKAIHERVNELLSLVGLTDKKDQFPPQLSGGQKQRVAIARALATKPSVLLCDEPTSALDPATTKEILVLLKNINRTLGVTIVIITHQMSVIEAVADTVAIIDQSELVEIGDVKDIFLHPKSEAAKKILLSGATSELPQACTYYRLVFQGERLSEPLIATLAIETNVKANIFYADIKTVVDAAYGEMILTLNHERDQPKIEAWLDRHQINYNKEVKQ